MTTGRFFQESRRVTRAAPNLFFVTTGVVECLRFEVWQWQKSRVSIVRLGPQSL